ncbi:MAG: 1-(5-phosphoribosyl)-5-[(5-phosphoribosylamino)methylideneamino] imidazole-4-carboxamide isomerase [Verrucomicrobiota bacterium]|jgi:phosphoribosylformimino-5-aminoimidazole carboxamide ribotide isomerase
MLFLPAIDLMGGEVVRLRQGKADQKTVYPAPPLAYARRWQDEGGDFLHIVDLDAAFSGVHANLEIVRDLARQLLIPIELGGGMRSAESIAAALNAGVARVVIGTRAAESLQFVADMVREFGSEKIAVGIDAKNGLVSTKGWTETSEINAFELAQRVEQAGVGTLIYTDIATDGMMAGPNYRELDRMLASVRCKVIASGGVSCLGDLQRLCQIPDLHGAIVGKALYDNALQLNSAVAYRNQLSH